MWSAISKQRKSEEIWGTTFLERRRKDRVKTALAGVPRRWARGEVLRGGGHLLAPVTLLIIPGGRVSRGPAWPHTTPVRGSRHTPSISNHASATVLAATKSCHTWLPSCPQALRRFLLRPCPRDLSARRKPRGCTGLLTA